ncbi:MAG: class I SAM-dependent methyltransferase [Candidatus Neomarinimicrobiota bacterium]
MDTPINVFSDWAQNGKDEGMERHHNESVMNMIDFACSGLSEYSFIDAGCGNGWVVRHISKDAKCNNAIGVDGSSNMINKAKRLDDKNKYFCEDLLKWIPQSKVDIVLSMEVFYYFENPGLLIEHINNNWIKSGGRLIMGVDYYQENISSHSWQKDCGISIMKLHSEKEWKVFFENAGLKDVKSWRNGQDEDWGGTLIVTGVH